MRLERAQTDKANLAAQLTKLRSYQEDSSLQGTVDALRAQLQRAKEEIEEQRVQYETLSKQANATKAELRRSQTDANKRDSATGAQAADSARLAREVSDLKVRVHGNGCFFSLLSVCPG